MDLFAEVGAAAATPAPLAERMRPRTLHEFRGQRHLLAPGSALHGMLAAPSLPASLFFWGPPGTGKTTLARLLARHFGSPFAAFSPVTGVQDVRDVVERARNLRQRGKQLFLFVDEVHFNRAQQDAFLPHLEAGTLALLGATTENPSFAVNAALLSRARVLELLPLPAEEIESILQAALEDAERGLGGLPLTLAPGLLAPGGAGERRCAHRPQRARDPGRAVPQRAAACGDGGATCGDAGAAQPGPGSRRRGALQFDCGAAQEPARQRSRCGAVLAGAPARGRRGSPVRGAPSRALRVGRRGQRRAASPGAHGRRHASRGHDRHARGRAGSGTSGAFPGQAPKSHRVTVAYEAARADVREHGHPPVPLHLRNAPTRLLRELGRGEGYLVPHDHAHGIVVQDYWPEGLGPRSYYEPSDAGEEPLVASRLQRWRELRATRGEPVA